MLAGCQTLGTGNGGDPILASRGESMLMLVPTRQREMGTEGTEKRGESTSSTRMQTQKERLHRMYVREL